MEAPMPIATIDFEARETAQERSARFDPDRPFLFEGLTPRYATRRIRGCFIPMRDGVRLSTDFHIPLGAQLPLPVVLVRTCYNKNYPSTAMPALLPEQGIIYAVQDVRGRYESEGAFTACSGDDRGDGYDTVDWIAAQPWCNGAVGTIGSSYTAETAAKTAAMRHPAHRCGVIMYDGAYGDGQTRNGAYLQGGVTLLRMMFGWFRDYVPKVSFGPPAGLDREAWYGSAYAEAYETQPIRQPPVDYATHLKTLPVYSLLDRTGAAPSDFAEQMRQSANPCSAFFRDQGFLTEADRFHTPTIFLTGPLERGGSGFENFRLFRNNAETAAAREHQYLWFTPAAHSGYASCEAHSTNGLRDFGDTRYPYYRDLVAWFAHWLRGDELDLDTWPKVRYFVSGKNVWKSDQDWPPSGVVTREMFLTPGADNHAGGLKWLSPGAEARELTFAYDPGDPMPSEPSGTPIDLLGGGYGDRSEIERRSDVLVYTSDAVTNPLRITGQVSVSLHVRSSALDTDFVAVLTEVDALGRSINITHGIARMRYRDGLDCPTLMTPGAAFAVTIDLWHVAIQIPPGHRIRLAVSSSYFPVFDRNLNTGGDNYTEANFVTAHNSVLHDEAHPSKLMLPLGSPI
jgi:predicted acyl esterase